MPSIIAPPPPSPSVEHQLPNAREVELEDEDGRQPLEEKIRRGGPGGGGRVSNQLVLQSCPPNLQTITCPCLH